MSRGKRLLDLNFFYELSLLSKNRIAGIDGPQYVNFVTFTLTFDLLTRLYKYSTFRIISKYNKSAKFKDQVFISWGLWHISYLNFFVVS